MEKKTELVKTPSNNELLYIAYMAYTGREGKARKHPAYAEFCKMLEFMAFMPAALENLKKVQHDNVASGSSGTLLPDQDGPGIPITGNDGGHGSGTRTVPLDAT